MKPSARATARATVDLPAPAGPSMATSMAAATIGHVKLLRPLRERDFALLWTGMTVSLLGDGIFIVAVAWQVYDIENDPVALSLVGLAWTGGMIAFLLTGGIVSDRMERRRVLIAADLVRALVLAATGVLSLAGVLEIWHLVVLAVLYGAGEAFFGPAFGALVPEIVAPRHLVQANSLEQLVRQAVRAPARARRSAASSSRPSAPAAPSWSTRATFAARARRASAALRVRSLPATRRRALGAPRAARGRHLRALAAVAVGDAGGGLAEPAALPRPARGAAALRRAQRPRRRRLGLRRDPLGRRRRLGARDARRQPARAAAALPDLRLRRVDRRHAALHRLRLRHHASGSSWPSPSSSARARPPGWSCGARSCPRACRPSCAAACTRWTGSSPSASRRSPSRSPARSRRRSAPTRRCVLAGVLPMVVVRRALRRGGAAPRRGPAPAARRGLRRARALRRPTRAAGRRRSRRPRPGRASRAPAARGPAPPGGGARAR